MSKVRHLKDNVICECHEFPILWLFFVLSRPPTYYCALYYLRCLPTVKKYFILNRNKTNIFDIFFSDQFRFPNQCFCQSNQWVIFQCCTMVSNSFFGLFLLLNPTQYFWLFCKFWRPKCHFFFEYISEKFIAKCPRHPKVSRNVFTSWINSDQMSNGAHPRLSLLVFHSQFVLLLVYFIVKKKITTGYGYYGYGWMWSKNSYMLGSMHRGSLHI